MNLLRQGKCRCASGTNQKPGGKAAFIRQRVEDNAFHPIKADRLLLNASPGRTDGKWVPAEGARSIKTFQTEGKLRRAAAPGQVKALDGVPPQSLDSQRSACVLQAFVVARSPAALRITHH